MCIHLFIMKGQFYIAALNVDSGTEDQLIRLKYYRKDVCNYRLP